MTRRPSGYEWMRPPRGTDDIPVGALVRDLDTGRVGVLQDVRWLATDQVDRPPLRAFLRPVGGGCEWTADPHRITPYPGASGAPR